MQHWHKSCWNMNAYFCAWFIVALLRAVWLSFVVSCSSSFEPESTSFFLLCMNYEPWATTAFLFQASSCRPVSLLISLGPALHWDFGFWNSHCFVTALHSGVMLHFTWLILVTGGYGEPTGGSIWWDLGTACFVLLRSGLQEASECGVFHAACLYLGVVPHKSIVSGLLLSYST